MTERRGRPRLSDGQKKPRKKYPAPLQVALSQDLEESELLKDRFYQRIGRDKLIQWLSMSDEDWNNLNI